MRACVCVTDCALSLFACVRGVSALLHVFMFVCLCFGMFEHVCAHVCGLAAFPTHPGGASTAPGKRPAPDGQVHLPSGGNSFFDTQRAICRRRGVMTGESWVTEQTGATRSGRPSCVNSCVQPADRGLACDLPPALPGTPCHELILRPPAQESGHETS